MEHYRKVFSLAEAGALPLRRRQLQEHARYTTKWFILRSCRNRSRGRGATIQALRTKTRPKHMGESPRQPWLRTAIFVALGYALVGIVFALPPTHVRAWRLAAWVISATGYAAHIAYERFWLRNLPGSAALHIAFAVAVGAFGLAVGANIHSLYSQSSNQHHQLLLLSLGIWPIITALPAFLVAFGSNVFLARVLGRVHGH